MDAEAAPAGLRLMCPALLQPGHRVLSSLRRRGMSQQFLNRGAAPACACCPCYARCCGGTTHGLGLLLQLRQQRAQILLLLLPERTNNEASRHLVDTSPSPLMPCFPCRPFSKACRALRALR